MKQDEEEDIWDLENMVGFRCSAFTWSKDKKRIRIWIPGKEELKEANVSEEITNNAPEKHVLLEFGKRDTETLKQFFIGM